MILVYFFGQQIKNSPLNFDLIFASSLLILFTSASLLLPKIKPKHNIMCIGFTSITDRNRLLRVALNNVYSVKKSYSQFRMSEINTAKPRIPSPLTAGIVAVYNNLTSEKVRKNIISQTKKYQHN